MSGHAQPILTIAVTCYRFQKRLAWMLRSLERQTFPQLVRVNVAVMEDEPLPESPLVQRSTWNDFDRFEYRGLVRNYQLQECETSWLMFSDCDMVYHPEFIERLCRELINSHADAPYMLAFGRMSISVPDANAAVDSDASFEALSKLPLTAMENVGAGYSQIINVRHCPHGGYYVKPDRNLDVPLRQVFNAKSDVQFRRRISANGNSWRRLPKWFSENAIHLNHERDLDFGKHLTHQR